MTRHPLQRLKEDAGFTLIELVVTVAIVSVIAVTIAGVMISSLRHTVDTQARLTESLDVQLANGYWQRDVSSIGVRQQAYDVAAQSYPLQQSVFSGAANGCALTGQAAGATPVVTLVWSDYDAAAIPISVDGTDADGNGIPDDVEPPTPTTVKITWAAKLNGASYELWRVRCGTVASQLRMAHSLRSVPTLTCANDAGAAVPCGGASLAVPATVALSLSVLDPQRRDLTPYARTLIGERRAS